MDDDLVKRYIDIQIAMQGKIIYRNYVNIWDITLVAG